MKANELMIGDWVYAIDDNGEKHPCRVNNLKYDYINKRDDFCVDFYGTGYDPEWPDVAFNVEPIPLTAEILEKNEWRCFNTYHKYSNLRAPFELQQQKDGGYTIEVNADEYGSATFLFILHVHQLQNALHICGIEHEIIL